MISLVNVATEFEALTFEFAFHRIAPRTVESKPGYGTKVAKSVQNEAIVAANAIPLDFLYTTMLDSISILNNLMRILICKYRKRFIC